MTTTSTPTPVRVKKQDFQIISMRQTPILVSGWVLGHIGLHTEEASYPRKHKRYRLTHLPTGMGIWTVDTRKQALSLAEALLPAIPKDGTWGVGPKREELDTALAAINTWREANHG